VHHPRPAEAFALADQVGVLEKGRLVQFGPPEQIYTQPATPFVARFTGLAGELAGTVADVAYRGRGYEYAIDLPGHGRLTGVFAPVRASRGESVGLRLDPEHCHVFAAADEPLATPTEDAPDVQPAVALSPTPPGLRAL
jgi:ABC-type Fe3+/spermidine/putrescine transport system ATPase subunit